MKDERPVNYWEDVDVLPSEEGGDSFLVRQFRAFYAELSLLRRDIERGAVVVNGEDAGEEDAAQSAAALQARLGAELQAQQQAVRRRGGESLVERYRLVKYAMVALADEVFLQMPWEGREYWYNHLLETREFDSQNAGTQVFEIIDRTLQRQAAELDVATVYLYVLALGFEGQYRDTRDDTALNEYRERLYRHIKQFQAQQLGEDRSVSPDAYRHTLDQGRVQLLPNLRWWVGGLVATAGLYILATTALWWWYTDDLSDLASDVLLMP